MTFKYENLPHYLSLGAGVQSSALALMYAAGELSPMPKAAIFADTQAEPESVYRWLDWLEEQLPFPVHRVTKGDLGKTISVMRTKADGSVYSESNIPFFAKDNVGNVTGFLKRQCTYQYKVRPINQQLRKLAKIKRGQAEVGAVSIIGISLDEFKRMKPAKEKWLVHRWPLVEQRYTRQKCKEWMQEKGFPAPPRSACTFCAFRHDKEWREMQVNEPEAFASAVEMDKALRKAKSENTEFEGTAWLHRSCRPLDQIDLRTDVERGQLTMWDDECEGMCGV